MIKLSIVVPTIGRKTLPATLESIANQMGPKDEALVVYDVNNTVASEKKIRKYCNPFLEGYNFKLIVCKSDMVTWGHHQRNVGMRYIKGTHFATIDDDDVYDSDAFEYFRIFAMDRPVIFKMQYSNGGTLWKHEGLIECGNVGSPMILAPIFDPMPKFGLHYAGDFDFISDCVTRFGEPTWRPEVVAHIRPNG